MKKLKKIKSIRLVLSDFDIKDGVWNEDQYMDINKCPIANAFKRLGLLYNPNVAPEDAREIGGRYCFCFFGNDWVVREFSKKLLSGKSYVVLKVTDLR